jgi:hypothetical protein
MPSSLPQASVLSNVPSSPFMPVTKGAPTSTAGVERVKRLATAGIRDTPDDAELTRRLISLISLLGIYAIGLVIVAFVSEGPDIGVLLAAILGHATFMGARYVIRAKRAHRTVVSAGPRGVVVYARRARFIRYHDIAMASATDTALTLRVRANRAGALADIVLHWSSAEGERHAVVSRIDGFVRKSQRAAVQPRPLSVAARSRESIARVAAALTEFTGPRSSTHIPAAG